MPWCETCDAMVDEEDVTEAGACPECGEALHEHRKIPWHFKLMIAGTAVYLGWRAYQGITWVVHHA